MAAAVADFRPKAPAEAKLKKEHGVPELILEPTPDILAELRERQAAGQILVGFAAETGCRGGRGPGEARRASTSICWSRTSSERRAPASGPTRTRRRS